LPGVPHPAILRGSMGRTFLLTLQFDGTGFCGWQRQAEGRSVQADVERMLSRLAGVPVRATAAGRTDAGVHALGMPVTARLPERWDAPQLLRASNAILPHSIAVTSVREVRPDVDARRSALGRRYQYDVGTDAASRSPFRCRTEWPLARSLDTAALGRATELVRGEHDFRAFAVVGEPKPHYRCRIVEAHWRPRVDGGLRFVIAADRFLHHMVRFLVGTMVEIGLGRRPEGELTELLRLDHNQRTAPPAPARGLSFVTAWYPDDIWLGPEAAW
jgi:tRNA pseudouridine38-40 synthase